MNLSELFSKTNLEVLKLLSEQEHHVREIAELLKISPSKAHQAIKIYKKYNIIETTKKKNTLIASLNYDSLLLDQILEIIDTYNYLNKGEFEVIKEVRHEKERRDFSLS